MKLIDWGNNEIKFHLKYKQFNVPYFIQVPRKGQALQRRFKISKNTVSFILVKIYRLTKVIVKISFNLHASPGAEPAYNV